MDHKSKEIRAAIKYALKKGWILEDTGSSSHAWGRLLCPYNDKKCRCGEFCQISIWGTPKNPSNFAKLIIKVVNNCIYNKMEKD